MKTNLIVFAVGVFMGVCLAAENGVISVGVATQGAADAKQGNEEGSVTLAILRAEFQQAKRMHDRLAAVRKIGALPDPLAKDALLEYYWGKPQSDAVIKSPQTLKLALLSAVLPRLESQDRVCFLMDTLRREVCALKEARQSGKDRYYSSDLFRKALQVLESDGVSAKDRDVLSGWASDGSVPEHTRSRLLAAVVRYDLEKGGKTTPADKAGFAIENMPVRPTAPIPWETYNEKQKRIEYGNSKAYAKKNEVFREWRMSEASIRTEAYENVLESCGLAAVGQLVAALGQISIPNERRDYLARLAASVLASLPEVKPQERDAVARTIAILEKYVWDMEDAGAGCNRNRAIQALYLYYKRMGITEYPKFKEGGSVLATVLGPAVDAVSTTNVTGAVQ